MPSTPSKGRSASGSTGGPSPAVPFPGSPSISSPSSRSPVPHNYHPYQIQTTASSLLTRSNSSPLQPVSEYKHRSSRSLSSMASVHSLSHSVSDGELAVTASQGGSRGSKGKDADREARRRSIDGSSPAPSVPKLRRSGTLPVFPKDEQMTPTKDSIPDNPKHWSPAHLARYLTTTLRNGDAGHTLPAPLIRDIEAWVLRQQVNGRAFLKGQSEAWATSARAPPFLQVLLNISRRLRRTSLQARLGDNPTSPTAQPDSPLGSILIEADEDQEGEEDEDDTGVRRMARAIERPASAASSASSASMEEIMRPRLNSGNSEGWKEWEARGMGWVGRRRKESGASSCADSVERFAMRLEKDKSQERSVSGGSATSATSASSGMSAESELLETPLDVATTKAPPVGLGFDMPPKISDAVAAPALLVDGSEAHDGNLLPNNLVITDPADATGDRPGDRPLSPHMSHTQQRQISGAKPYASIRLASGTRAPSLRSMRQAQTLLSGADGTKGDEADDEMSHLSTARRVTLRPTAADIFSAKSEREEEMEKQLAALAGKVKELEEQLVSIQAKKVEEEQSEQPGAAGGGGEHVREAEEAATELETEEAEPKDKPVQARPGSPFDLLPEGILTRLGLIPEQDGLPTRMRELPAYLFFVGVGVGAVMVKVLFSRSR